MSQSRSRVLIHLIYSTKGREPWLDEPIRDELYRYQAGIFTKIESPAIVIGGVEDHVHALFVLSKNWALKRAIEEVKKHSSAWMKTQGSAYAKFQWQAGYGAFSIGESQIARVRNYIETQEDHHKRETFKEEFRKFLKKYKVDYDERYVWD